MKDWDSRSRTVALVVLGVVLLIFIFLSAASFDGSRQRPAPETFTFQAMDAVEGKRVFQAYNCMGCHTMLGNGAYFGPDLTQVYADGGPAWLETFIAAPATWPSKTAVNLWIGRLRQSGDLNLTPDEYYQKYPHVLEAVERFGGQATNMPNLNLKADEITSVIAFFSYASAINTEGWPPEPRADARIVERVKAAYGAGPVTASGQVNPLSAADQGKQLAQDLGCAACHSTDGTTKVGPTWKGLAGSTVPLVDGTSATADDAYLRESILQPNAKIVRGFAPGVMPNFDGMVTTGDIDNLIAYIKSLN